MRSTFIKLTLSLALIATVSTSVFAQDEEWAREESKFYFSTGGEMIFSWSNTSHPTSTDGVVVRWAPVFNLQGFINYDFARAVGVMAGLGIRNVGYIYHFNDVGGREFRKKFRTYSLGIPVALKVGNVDGFHVYGGYEIEFPFHYKEKTFDSDNSKINKFTSWFSDRTNNVQHCLFAGIQFREGLNLKFKYYLTEFHNQDFTQTTDDPYAPSGIATEPYRGVESNVMYISVSSIISKKTYQYYKPPVKKKSR